MHPWLGHELRSTGTETAAQIDALLFLESMRLVEPFPIRTFRSPVWI